MKSKTYTGEYSLKHWVNLMIRKNIVLPEYQRSFVWEVQDVERLILSFKSGQFIQPITIARMNTVGNGKNSILDGQQRLTSILLLAINCFPKRDKFKELEVIATEDDSAKDELDGMSESKIMGWTFETLLDKDDSKNTLEAIKYRVTKNDKYETIQFKNPDCIMTETDLDSFLENTFLSFSFIVPETTDAAAEQMFFSTLFRNMNYFGHKLSAFESRKSLYYLNEKYKYYFEGKLEDGSDALAGLKIIENVAPRSIDFVRYLSILSQYDGYKSSRNVMVGYSSYASRENYYVDYVSYILGLEQENRKDKFDRFSFNKTFGTTGVQPRYVKLAESILKLKDKMNFDKKYPDAFRSWIDADYWLFGLIYWIVFKNMDIDLDGQLPSNVIKVIEDRKKTDNYSRTPNLLMHLRARIDGSINLFKQHII